MKDFDNPFKHLSKPLIPKTFLDSMKPFTELQERHKRLFADAFRLNEISRAAFEPYQSMLSESILTPPKIEIPGIDSLKQLSDSFAFNYADSFIKKNQEISKLFSSSILDSFKTSNLLGQHFAELQNISHFAGVGVASSLKIFDDALYGNVSSILDQFRADPEFFNDLLRNAEEDKINAYSLKSVFEYLSIKAPDIFSLDKAVVFLIGMIIQIHLQQFWNQYVVGPNICIAKSGCRIRVDGTIQSDIKTAVPNGEEILVLEDHGKWKKVFWLKDTGETYEGWMSSSLIEWKYKNQLKED